MSWSTDKILGIEHMAASTAHKSLQFVGERVGHSAHVAMGLYGGASALVTQEKAVIRDRVSKTRAYGIVSSVEGRLDEKNHQAAELRFELALAEDKRLEAMGLSRHDPIYQNYGDLCGSGRETMDFFSDISGALSFAAELAAFTAGGLGFVTGGQLPSPFPHSKQPLREWTRYLAGRLMRLPS